MQFDPKKKPEYIFKYPFRFVKPYSHVFQTHAKQRWLGKNLLATLSKQFQAYSEQYFRQAIKVGKVLINRKKVDVDYIIKNSDLLQHQTVREQPPILNIPIQIIHEDQDFLIVCKPPSMVVHTGGGYHYNTLMAILYYEMRYTNLYILHRIDRLTSGVVILSKKKQKTTKFHQQSIEQIMKKCYYARVSGNFKQQQKIVDAPLICLSHREGIWGVFNPQTMKDLLKIQQPKQSTTKFVKLWYNQETDSSLLECYPVTGRTHQIRVHLSHIGHPILNDTVYNGKFVGNWVINNIKDQKNILKEQQKLQKSQDKTQLKEQNHFKIQERIQQKEQIQCQKNLQIDLQKWDYKSRPLQIFLHSFKYRFQSKQYGSKKPYWTQPSLKIIQSSNQIKKQQKNKSNYEIQFLISAKQKYQKQQKAKNAENESKFEQNKRQVQNQQGDGQK